MVAVAARIMGVKHPAVYLQGIMMHLESRNGSN